MNNLLSYCGLVDAKIRASDIDLPVKGFSNRLSKSSVTCFSQLPKQNLNLRHAQFFTHPKYSCQFELLTPLRSTKDQKNH